MATVAVGLPRTRRRPKNEPVAGRASYPEIYFVKRIDNSRLERVVDTAKRRECFGLLGMGTIAFLFIMLFAWQHFECVRYGYQIQQLKSKHASMVEWNHTLKVEFASLSDPQRIDAVAQTKLGLVPPRPGQIIQVLRPRNDLLFCFGIDYSQHWVAFPFPRIRRASFLDLRGRITPPSHFRRSTTSGYTSITSCSCSIAAALPTRARRASSVAAIAVG